MDSYTIDFIPRFQVLLTKRAQGATPNYTRRLWDVIRSSPSIGTPQAVMIHNSLSTAACTSVDTVAIVYVLLDRVDGCARPTRFLTPLTFCCADMFSRLSLCGAILKYTTITNIFLQYHSHRASGGLNKSRIITAKQPEF